MSDFKSMAEAAGMTAAEAAANCNPGELRFFYRNWKGQTSLRRIDAKVEILIKWGIQEPYHNTPQFLLHAFDLDRQEWRAFALSEIRWVEMIYGR